MSAHPGLSFAQIHAALAWYYDHRGELDAEIEQRLQRRVVKIGENALQYSLQDTTRHALFLVTSRVEKFVGKTTVDTIAVRLGAIMSAVVVWFGTQFGMPTAAFAVLNVVLTAAWIGFAIAISGPGAAWIQVHQRGLAGSQEAGIEARRPGSPPRLARRAPGAELRTRRDPAPRRPQSGT